MNTYVNEQARWSDAMAALSDAEIVETFNKQVGLRCFTSARGVYLECLKEALLARDFDCSFLIKNRQGHEVFVLARKVRLEERVLVGVGL